MLEQQREFICSRTIMAAASLGRLSDQDLYTEPGELVESLHPSRLHSPAVALALVGEYALQPCWTSPWRAAARQRFLHTPEGCL